MPIIEYDGEMYESDYDPQLTLTATRMPAHWNQPVEISSELTEIDKENLQKLLLGVNAPKKDTRKMVRRIRSNEAAITAGKNG